MADSNPRTPAKVNVKVNTELKKSLTAFYQEQRKANEEITFTGTARLFLASPANKELVEGDRAKCETENIISISYRYTEEDYVKRLAGVLSRDTKTTTPRNSQFSREFLDRLKSYVVEKNGLAFRAVIQDMKEADKFKAEQLGHMFYEQYDMLHMDDDEFEKKVRDALYNQYRRRGYRNPNLLSFEFQRRIDWTETPHRIWTTLDGPTMHQEMKRLGLDDPDDLYKKIMKTYNDIVKRSKEQQKKEVATSKSPSAGSIVSDMAFVKEYMSVERNHTFDYGVDDEEEDVVRDLFGELSITGAGGGRGGDAVIYRDPRPATTATTTTTTTTDAPTAKTPVSPATTDDNTTISVSSIGSSGPDAGRGIVNTALDIVADATVFTVGAMVAGINAVAGGEVKQDTEEEKK